MRIPDDGSSMGIDRSLATASFAAIGGVGAAFIVLLPFYVGGFVDQLGFDERSAGYIAAADMAGYAVATLGAALWIHRSSWRTVGIVSLGLLASCNAVSAFAKGFLTLASFRFGAGFAAGTATAVVVATMSKTRDPDRTFGFWVVGQLLLGAAGSLILPAIIESFGMPGAFSLLVALSLSVLPATLHLPKTPLQTPVGVTAGDTPTGSIALLGGLGIASILIIYVGQASVWAFYERLAAEAALAPQTIGLSLSVASLAGLVGGIGAIFLGSSVDRLIPISISIACIVTSLALLLPEFSTPAYVISGSLFLFGWNFILPFLMGAIAALDTRGKLVSLANASIGLGLIGGPLLGAAILGAADYDELVLVSIGCAVLGGLLIYPLTRPRRSSNDASAAKRMMKERA